MDMKFLRTGIEKYKTPLYVFNLDEMAETLLYFKQKFGSAVGICFAIKANPFLASQISEMVDRIEVCSMGEFEICRHLGIMPEKILISGVLKEKEDILKILNYYRGRCIYTIESLNQFNCLAGWCEENCEVIHVFLRLSSGNQFGMDEEMVRYILAVSSRYPFMKIQGIHYFSGTQKKSVEKIKKEVLYLDEFCRQLERTEGIFIQEVEYGPGIPVKYFQNQKDELELYLTEISRAIFDMKWNGNVILEIGRALVASCGYYLTKVKDIKKNNGRNYCIVDGGIHQIQYDGQIRGMYHPGLRVISGLESEEDQEWTICGSLCTVNDVLVRNIRLGDLKIDDVLIFEQVGAYAVMEGMALFLSHELPTVVFFSRENEWKLVRRKQSTYRWNMEEINDGNFDRHFNGNR